MLSGIYYMTWLEVITVNKCCLYTSDACMCSGNSSYDAKSLCNAKKLQS